MSTHTARISWSRNNQNFLDNQYTRVHKWQFDGGLKIEASSSPSVVPVPLFKLFNLNLSTLIFIFLFSLCLPAYSLNNQPLSAEQLSTSLEQCLKSDWGIDNNTALFIHKKFKPLLDNINHHEVVREFIKLSKETKIDFSKIKPIKTLPEDDGIYVAPQEHLVVFENPYIRILEGSTKPGVKEGSHSHQWESIMVVIRPTTYEIEYPNGTKETTPFPIGTYKLPAGEKYACKNVGSVSDECLRFEIK